MTAQEQHSDQPDENDRNDQQDQQAQQDPQDQNDQHDRDGAGHVSTGTKETPATTAPRRPFPSW